jgi:hypothetical protein
VSRVADAIADKTLGQFESFLSDLRTGSRNYLTLANSTEQIDHQYRGRGLIELVQNAYDALGDVRPSRVRVELVDDQGSHGALLVANTGRPLTDANFRAMVSLFQSGKRPGEGVGHKGVGFKSVLELTDAPEIFSRSTSEAPVLDGYCFRLDPGTPASWASALRAHGDSPRPLTLELGGRTRTIEAGTIALAREAAERLGLSLEEELQRLSPYLLPLPIASDVRAGELVARGFATLVRLPLRDAAARAEAARQVADLRNGEVLLFLDGLDRLELVESRSGGLSIERVSERNPDESLTILLEDDSGLVTEHRRWDRSLAVAGELTEARSLLPKAWAELARVDLSIAVPAYSAQREPTAGHVFVHFPTRTMSGSAARIQAHFHAELSRQGLTRDRWNDVLMRELVALALDVCARLAASNDPRDLPLLIDLLAPCGGAAGSSVWHTELLEQVRERALFRDRQGQLRALRELRRARPPAGPLVITQELLSDNASFHELAPGYGPRLDELDALAARLGIRLEPTEAEMAATLARVANALADRGGLTEDWAGFYEDCSDLLPNASALLGKRVVIDHHGALQVAGRGGEPERPVFLPSTGRDSARPGSPRRSDRVPVRDNCADRLEPENADAGASVPRAASRQLRRPHRDRARRPPVAPAGTRRPG